MSFFNLKLAISGNRYIDPFIELKKISHIDEKIAKKISGYEFDYETVKKSRISNRNDILKLGRTMNRVNSKDLSSYNKTCMKSIRRYENALKRQLKDILKIIIELKKLIENEYLEIIYDLRSPLKIFEHFIEEIKKNSIGLEVKKKIGKEIEKIFNEIESSYSKLLDYTFQFLENELKYYNSIGINFNKFNNNLETDYAFSTHIKNRTKIKQQINGKTQWIKSQIKRLENSLKELTKKGVLDKKQSQIFLQIINYFREQFQGLIDYCIKRIDISNHMIIEAIVIQKEKYEEIENLKKELKRFYKEFIQEQERILTNISKGNKIFQIKKRIEEFKNYEIKLEQEIKNFEKKFTLIANKLEEKEVECLTVEKNDLNKVKESFPKFKRNFKKSVIILSAFISINATMSFNQTLPLNIKSPKNIEQILVQKSTEIDACAEWVINQYVGMSSLSKNEIADFVGVIGNAWTIMGNIVNRKGRAYYNVFNDINQENFNLLKEEINREFEVLSNQNISEKTIFSTLNKQYSEKILNLYPQQKKINKNEIKIGDIVGLRYNPSNNHVLAFLTHTRNTFNTHVGIVSSIEGGEIIISHNINGTIHHDPIENLIGYNNTSSIVWLARPNLISMIGREILDNNIIQKYERSNIKINDNLLSNQTIKFTIGLNENYSLVSEYYNLSKIEMDKIVKLSFGIFGVESNFGSARSYHMEKFVDTFLRNMMIKLNISRGGVQYKSGLSDKELNDFSINLNDINNYETCAKIVLVYLAKSYSFAKEMGYTGDNLIYITIASYNRGIGVINNRNLKNGLNHFEHTDILGRKTDTRNYERIVLNHMNDINVLH